METVRRQITLFVPDPERPWLDAIREQLNPAQAALIAAHVTLCRDDEVTEWSALQVRANQMSEFAVSLRFGEPVRERNLVYLPVVGSTEGFDELRRHVLDDDACRIQEPHITLIHPRNGTCTDAVFSAIQSLFPREIAVTFRKLTFIEKTGERPWRSLRTVPGIRQQGGRDNAQSINLNK